jgi:hypothetical protein
MSKQSKFANEPLLYIQQSTSSMPNAPMQHFYTTPRKSIKSEAPTVEAEKKTKQPAIKRRPSISSYLGSAIPDNETMAKGQPEELNNTNNTVQKEMKETKETKETKKKFKDMTINEKIDYFINTPSHLPRMRCEVITLERKYRGTILDFKDNEIQMRVGKKIILLKLEDITEIQLLGF